MNLLAILICLCVVTQKVSSRPSLGSPCGGCEPLKPSSIIQQFGERVALIKCGDIHKLTICSHGKWSPDPYCFNEDLINASVVNSSEIKNIVREPRSTRDHFRKKEKPSPTDEPFRFREKRSPDLRKYQQRRLNGKVQRQIEAGLVKPKIDTSTPALYRAHPGSNVYLACRIENLGSFAVLWMNEDEKSVLALDNSRVTHNIRVQPMYEDTTETWILEIKSVQEEDAGQYSCMVNTPQEALKRTINLEIVPHNQPLIGIATNRAENNDLNFVLQNITALWESIDDLRHEIDQHLHDGHTEPHHDKVMDEVGTLHHEHHVHHLHHPHEGHQEHHDEGMLHHLTDVHQHIDNHSGGAPVPDVVHGHGPSHDHLDVLAHGQHQHVDNHDVHHNIHNSHEHEAHHENIDAHDAHGLHSHEDEEQYPHEFGHQHSASNPDEYVDPWMYASCALMPNKGTNSNVQGYIVMSQRRDLNGPVYFDINIKGFDVANTGRIHGFHVHGKPVISGDCGKTGGHFNPDQHAHGAPHDNVRHAGDLGNIEVDENGELHHHIISDSLLSFNGTRSIIHKAIVVHAGEDDLGTGGDAGSLATGNAGGRLACCNILQVKEKIKTFRFKG